MKWCQKSKQYHFYLYLIHLYHTYTCIQYCNILICDKNLVTPCKKKVCLFKMHSVFTTISATGFLWSEIWFRHTKLPLTRCFLLPPKLRVFLGSVNAFQRTMPTLVLKEWWSDENCFIKLYNRILIINRAEMKIYGGETYIYHGRAQETLGFHMSNYLYLPLILPFLPNSMKI